MSLTDGISRTDGIYKWFDRFEGTYRKAGFRLLPEAYQPFLQKRKGIVVHAKEDIDVRNIVSPAVLNSLRSGGHGGAASYKGRIVVWTYAEANPEKLFDAARGLRGGLLYSN